MWLTSWWVAWFLNFYGSSHIYKLHGILSNSMNMLWHSMELHQYLREPHGIPWNSTIFHGIPWTSKELHQYFKELHGTPWILHGPPWHSMELRGYSMDTPWKFHGIPSNSIDFHEIPWISIDFHGFPVHGIPWRYFTRVRECNLSLQNTVQLLLWDTVMTHTKCFSKT